MELQGSVLRGLPGSRGETDIVQTGVESVGVGADAVMSRVQQPQMSWCVVVGVQRQHLAPNCAHIKKTF